ncbi:hypothetical protein CCOS2040_22355 [Streptomyces albidoflavus]|nr:hypothetical protein CCOS2040_22355 [Streptomyces albidoflavus]
MGGAAVPEGPGAVADQEGDAASGGVDEAVGGVQGGAVAARAAADGGPAVVGGVEVADVQVAEGAEAAEDLPQLVEEPLPDPHRAGGVEDQLEQGLTAVDGPEDGQHQPPGPGGEFGGGALVQHLPPGSGAGPVRLERAERALKSERGGEHRGGGHPDRQRAGGRAVVGDGGRPGVQGYAGLGAGLARGAGRCHRAAGKRLHGRSGARCGGARPVLGGGLGRGLPLRPGGRGVGRGGCGAPVRAASQRASRRCSASTSSPASRSRATSSGNGSRGVRRWGGRGAGQGGRPGRGGPWLRSSSLTSAGRVAG